MYLRFHWSKNSVSTSDHQRLTNKQNSTERASVLCVCVCVGLCECTCINGFELLAGETCFALSACILLHNPVLDITDAPKEPKKRNPVPLLGRNVVLNCLCVWSQRNARVYILTHNTYLALFWITFVILVDLTLKSEGWLMISQTQTDEEDCIYKCVCRLTCFKRSQHTIGFY